MNPGKSMKMKAYASFAEWKADQSAQNKKLISILQRVIKEQAPHLDTGVKWGQGCWFDGFVQVMFIHAEPDHIQFGFYMGSDMDDPLRLLRGKGKHVRHVRIESQKDIDPGALSDLIAQVV